MSVQSTYTVLTPEAHIAYHDGRTAADYACIGIVEASSPDDAVQKAVENSSPMSRELAESSEFLVFEVTGERHYAYYGDNKSAESAPPSPA